MRYICLDCGREWDTVAFGYRRCVYSNCRSYDTAPASFWDMVENARSLGINDNTPILDLISAFKAVRSEQSILTLGFREFRRVVKRVIKEVEHPRPSRVHVE